MVLRETLAIHLNEGDWYSGGWRESLEIPWDRQREQKKRGVGFPNAALLIVSLNLEHPADFQIDHVEARGTGCFSEIHPLADPSQFQEGCVVVELVAQAQSRLIRKRVGTMGWIRGVANVAPPWIPPAARRR